VHDVLGNECRAQAAQGWDRRREAPQHHHLQRRRLHLCGVALRCSSSLSFFIVFQFRRNFFRQKRKEIEKENEKNS
jgi:hypothetical protein